MLWTLKRRVLERKFVCDATDRPAVMQGTGLRTEAGAGPPGFPGSFYPCAGVRRVCFCSPPRSACTSTPDRGKREAQHLQDGGHRDRPPWVWGRAAACPHICWTRHALDTVCRVVARPGPGWRASCSRPSRQERSDGGKVLTTAPLTCRHPGAENWDKF